MHTLNNVKINNFCMSVGRKTNTKARLKDKQQTRKTESKIYT